MTPIDYSRVTLPIGPVIYGARWNRKEIVLDVEIRDWNGNPDCRVGHFGHNFFVRTAAGMAMKKYTSLEKMKAAIERRLMEVGMPVIRWEPNSSS